MPDWFEIIEAARWAGVEPWELARQPAYWKHAILMHKTVMEPLENTKKNKQG